MPSFDSIVVGENWISEHFFTTDSVKESFQAEVAKLRKSWDEQGKEGHSSALSRFSEVRGRLQILLAGLSEDAVGAPEAYDLLRTALGFKGTTADVALDRSGTEMLVPGVWATENYEVLFVEAAPADAAEDVLSTVLPLGRVLVDGKEPKPALTVAKVVSEMYLSERAPKYVIIMAGRWLMLTEQERWAEGRYLAADVLLVADRNDTKKHAETDRFLAIFGRDSLLPSPDGALWWDGVLEASVKHTVGVSQDLREGIRRSIEIIANDVLKRRAAQGISADDVDGQLLARQSLRFLYRILFLLYAEASPEMGVLPVGAGEYNEGYGLDRLRELTLVNIQSPASQQGTHIYESLERLFRLVDDGHGHGDGSTSEEASAVNEGLVFQPLKADLFLPAATFLIDEVKLSNMELQRVLQHLLLSKETRGRDRGFISYAELGINQLGAVYEGLMSYTGFIAETDLYEVAKDGNSEKGSWVVPVDRSESIEARHFVMAVDEQTGEKRPVVHRAGSFVFRLAGRERQQSASYYTPEVLTKFVVSQALAELLDQDGMLTPADDILKLTVCEPALGSGAFAIEAVRQLADEYLKRKQTELDIQIPADEYPQELQKVKAQIALHQVHGVDLNSTAVELAEVSLWLDTMVKDLQAPWFGLRLRRGNSLIGARRATYSRQSVNDKSWLTSAPQDAPLTGLVDAMQRATDDEAVIGRIHHFLLPAAGWGAAADAKEVKDLASDPQQRLKAWRKQVLGKPTKAQVDRFAKLANRVEVLWKFALRRLQIADAGARRYIDYFGRCTSEGAHGEPVGVEAVSREQIEEALGNPNSAYQRLRRVMDAWNALWFWPLTDAATRGLQPPSVNEWVAALEGILGRLEYLPAAHHKFGRAQGQQMLSASMTWADLDVSEPLAIATSRAVGIDQVLREHPWLKVCEEVAQEQGFFHWELDFASVFGRGGFDLQVGNPPWVRPRSDEAALLAEGDPWWQLAEKPTQGAVKTRRAQTLARDGMLELFVDNAIAAPVVAEYLGSNSTYPVLSGLQPDLYRAFMVRTWTSASKQGAVALIHPESHFTEKKAATLRAETYRHLRRHWQFTNSLSLFEVHANTVYGVHVYGPRKSEPGFLSASFLYHPDTVVRSLEHRGEGEVPGVKTMDGAWDTRPHRERIAFVDSNTLRVWADLLDEEKTPYSEARMVYAVNTSSSKVLEKMGKLPKLKELGLQYSRGWDETIDRKKGYIEYGTMDDASWEDTILQGSHLTTFNPVYKTFETPGKGKASWSEVDLLSLPLDYVPKSGLQPVGDRAAYDAAYGSWVDGAGVGRPVRNFYRVAWRLMIAHDIRRSLNVAMIPPGAGHTLSLQSAGSPEMTAAQLLLLLATLGSIPADFLLKTTGLANLYGLSINRFPRVLAESQLTGEIVRRAAQLVCCTSAYARLWNEVSGSKWNEASWVRRADARRQLEIEIDVLISIAWGITVDELCAIYRTQFPILAKAEKHAFFDKNGHLVPSVISNLYRKHGGRLTVDERTWTHLQSGVEYVFEFPFRSFDREEDMRNAFAHFEMILAEQSS
ncbi:DNA methyltransferase [Arthrobacter sp. NPDC055138]